MRKPLSMPQAKHPRIKKMPGQVRLGLEVNGIDEKRNCISATSYLDLG